MKTSLGMIVILMMTACASVPTKTTASGIEQSYEVLSQRLSGV